MMLYQSAPGDPTTFFCGLGFTAFAGVCLLLFVAIRMWREEQDRRAGVTKPEKPASGGESGTTAMQKAVQWLQGAAKVAAQAASSVSMRSNPSDTHETMRLLRDNLTGRLIVEIAGKRYARLGDIQDPNISEAVLTTVRDLNRFSGGQTPLPPAGLETEISNED
jgi:hypothetical protein